MLFLIYWIRGPTFQKDNVPRAARTFNEAANAPEMWQYSISFRDLSIEHQKMLYAASKQDRIRKHKARFVELAT